MGKLVVTERYKIEKYDGEYTEGAKPVETVEVVVENGNVVKVTTTKEKE